MGDATLMDGFALGLHTLPSTATLLLEGLDGAGDALWSKRWRGVPASLPLRLKHSRCCAAATHGRQRDGRRYRLDLGRRSAAVPKLAQRHDADPQLAGGQRTLSWRWIGRLAHLGRRQQLSSYQPEIDDLLALLDHAKANHDEPLILIPNPAFPADARLVRFDGDSFEWSEWFNFQVQDDATEDYRVIGTRTLPFVGVVA